MLLRKDEKLVMIGDSVTDFGRARPIGEGRDAHGTGYAALVDAFLRSTYPELNLRTVNMGVSGNTVLDLKDRWQTDVFDLKPDWVTVLIGINDVWRQYDLPQIVERHVALNDYERTLDELVTATLPRVRGMVLMTPYYMEPLKDDWMRATMDEYGAAVKRVAARHNVPCVDLQAKFDELFEHVHSASIAWDRVHPNLTGHMLIARALLDALEFEK